MEWQLLIVVIAVMLAATYLGRRFVRSWRDGKSGCGGSCACPSAPARARSEVSWISTEELTARLSQPRRPD